LTPDYGQTHMANVRESHNVELAAGDEAFRTLAYYIVHTEHASICCSSLESIQASNNKDLNTSLAI